MPPIYERPRNAKVITCFLSFTQIFETPKLKLLWDTNDEKFEPPKSKMTRIKLTLICAERHVTKLN